MGIPAEITTSYPLPPDYAHLQKRVFQTKSIVRNLHSRFKIESSGHAYILNMYRQNSLIDYEFVGQVTIDGLHKVRFYGGGVVFIATFEMYICQGIEVFTGRQHEQD